jgi:hypothetical protein
VTLTLWSKQLSPVAERLAIGSGPLPAMLCVRYRKKERTVSMTLLVIVGLTCRLTTVELNAKAKKMAFQLYFLSRSI